MDSRDFDFQRIAEGYKKRPFLHKQVVERFGMEVTGRSFSRGLDMGCGAGLSSKVKSKEIIIERDRQNKKKRNKGI